MEHLYREDPPAQRAAIEAHVRGCPACQTQVALWRRTMSSLDSWALPVRPSPRLARVRAWGPMVRWTAAAAVLVAAGFLAGRTALPASPTPADLQATLRQEIATQVASAMARERTTLATELRAAATESASQETRRWLVSFAEALDERRQEDAEYYSAALEQVDARNAAAVSRLRRDLSTVAVVADARLLNTQEQLLQLANATPASAK